MTESPTPSPATQQARPGPRRTGADANAAEARRVRAQDRAVIAVFAELDPAEVVVERLVSAGFPAQHLSIVAKDPGGEVHATGFLGHFVEERLIPEYEEHVRVGDHLLVAYGTEQDVRRAERVLGDSGATDVRRHDRHRSDPGPIADVREGMRVVDAGGDEVGRVTEVKMGDPGAVTTQGQTVSDEPALEAEKPHLPPELSDRLLRNGYIKVDRKGLFRSDVYAGADQIAAVDGDTVRLAVDQHLLYSEA